MTSSFKQIDKIKPFYDMVYKIVLFICKLLLIGDILITSMAVAGRMEQSILNKIFSDPAAIPKWIPMIPDPAWSEQVVLTFMAYMAVLSAALAIRRGTHIRMTAFDKYLPKKLVKFLDIIADIAVFILAIIMIKIGWRYASTIGARGFYESMPTLSRFWMYFPIPLAGIAMVVFEIEALYNHVKDIFSEEGDENGSK